MRSAAITVGAAGMALVQLPSGAAAAAPLRGDMGPQSRASIRISVSVAPRFGLDRAAAGRKADGPGVAAFNAPALRYTIVADTAAGPAIPPAGTMAMPSAVPFPDKAADDRRAAALLYIVVPD